MGDREPTRWQHYRIYPQYLSVNNARNTMRTFLRRMWSLHNHITVMHPQRLMDWGYMRLCCHLVGSRTLIGSKQSVMTLGDTRLIIWFDFDKRTLDPTSINSIQLHTTQIAWCDTRHDFPANLSQPIVFNQLVASRVTGLTDLWNCLFHEIERALWYIGLTTGSNKL